MWLSVTLQQIKTGPSLATMKSDWPAADPACSHTAHDHHHTTPVSPPPALLALLRSELKCHVTFRLHQPPPGSAAIVIRPFDLSQAPR